MRKHENKHTVYRGFIVFDRVNKGSTMAGMYEGGKLLSGI